MNTVVLYIVVAIATVHFGEALECYVCDRQQDNKGKCLQTIKTCEQFDDVCLSEIAWGSTPYWSHHAEKQYYVSKRCAKKSDCENLRRKNMKTCTHIWYEDWKCSECCLGDRCNYYVILGGSSVRASFLLLSAGLLSLFFGARVWHT